MYYVVCYYKWVELEKIGLNYRQKEAIQILDKRTQNSPLKYQTKLVWFSNGTSIRVTTASSSSKMLPGISDKWFKTMGSCHAMNMAMASVNGRESKK